MTWYRVMLRGEDISLLFQDTTVVGFVTTQAVKAESAEEAVTKAKAQVKERWVNEGHAKENKGPGPSLHTEEVAELSWWQARKIPNKGYVFFGSE